MFGKKQETIKVIVIPVSGPVSSKKAKIHPAMTIAQILEEAGVSVKGMEVSLDGKPVTDLNQPINSGVIKMRQVTVKKKKSPAPEPRRELVASERVSGS